MLIDGKSGTVLNANTVDLRQVNTWRANQKPAFVKEGKLMGDSSSITVYDYDEEKSRMPLPVRLNNPLYEQMPVEVTLEPIKLADGTQIEFKDAKGEIAHSNTQSYKLTPNAVDSTMMLYLNIADKFNDSQSSVKLTVKYNGNIIAQQFVNFDFIKSVEGINPYTVRITGQLGNMLPEAVKDTLTTITLGGRLCGADIIYMRDSLNAKCIDMSKARIVAGPGAYYSDYLTENDIIGVRLFTGFSKTESIILPDNATEISNYALYQNKRLSKVVIGDSVKTIGNYAFSGCDAIERITIPASVTSIGRQAFKGCPFVCVICEGETPAEVGAKAFENSYITNATLVVPSAAAVEAYKAAKVWQDFGTIISYDQYLTNIAPVTDEAGVAVQDGKIVVTEDTEVAIYTFAGKQVASGKAGTYTLPAGNYIVKVGKNAVKVRL